SELNFNIGRNPPGTDPPENWNGSIDEVAVYDHVLTGDQIANHYNLGIGGGSAPGRTSAPRAVLASDIARLLVAELAQPATDQVGQGISSAAVLQAERPGLEVAAVDQQFASLTADDPLSVPPPARPDDSWRPDGSLTQELVLVV